MNLANKLTVLRVFMTPFFLLTLVWQFPYHYFVALLIFIAASLTDYWDGKIAREQNLVTDFGKFVDPIADKMLTTSAFLGFMILGHGEGILWITFAVLTREFLVASVRMMAAAKGNVIAADVWGKVKTVVQMVAIIMVMAFHGFMDLFARFCPDFTMLNTPMVVLYNVALWGSAVLTMFSGFNYWWKNRQCMDLTNL